jgi:hypothetical protein
MLEHHRIQVATTPRGCGKWAFDPMAYRAKNILLLAQLKLSFSLGRIRKTGPSPLQKVNAFQEKIEER